MDEDEETRRGLERHFQMNKLCKKASEETDIRIKNGDTVRIEWQTDPTDPDFKYEALPPIVRGHVVWFVNGKKVSQLPLTSVQMRNTKLPEWRQRYETIDMRFAVSGHSDHHTFEIVEVSAISASTNTVS